ncbi:hypothetical protein [Halobacterium salinarum]|uniref:hypothetical protein n=1 Tax=Halobacterium salinarum TaxID=2242 RepID=UPI0025546F4F|nr:hypothetical protein [Halobacterium salinarum]MDL0134961.1 hypothetical protein [Halobacterium salinarum]
MAVRASDSSKDLSEMTVIDVQTVREHDSLLFIGLSGTDTVLYYARGTSGVEDKANNIVQVTDPSQGSVWNLTAVSDTNFRYWQNGQIHEVAVDSDGSVSMPESISKEQTPRDIEAEEPASPSQVAPDQWTKPPGGAGPEWTRDSDLHQPPKTKSQSTTLLNNTIFEVEISTGGTSIIYKADCDGDDIPMLGATVDEISVETALDGLSVSLDLYAGVNPDTECLYFGSEQADFCLSSCVIPLATAAAKDFENAIDDGVEEVMQSIKDTIHTLEGIGTMKVAGAAILVMCAVAIAVFCPAVLVPATTALAEGSYLVAA